MSVAFIVALARLSFAFFSKVFEEKRLLAVKGSVPPLFNNFCFALNVCLVNHDSTILDLFTKIEFIQMPHFIAALHSSD